MVFEKEAQERHEYYGGEGGELLAVAGGTRNHNLLTGNSYRVIFDAVKG